ncbi:uncharacterized protein LOC116162749 [Photinus pyralis]|nr:uncharacterized protein LOC116162749 [Photinus pyralis]
MFKQIDLLLRSNVTLIIILDLLNFCHGITTTHYDKPALQKSTHGRTEFANLTGIERQKRLLPYINFYVTQNLQQSQNEDYYIPEDHYHGDKQKIHPSSQIKYSELLQATYQPTHAYQPDRRPYQVKTKFTPFLETNALPGPFTPMIPQLPKVKLVYTPIDHKEKIPNYSAIYEKLPQIKLQHSIIEPTPTFEPQKTVLQFFQRKPHVSYIPLQEHHREAYTPPKTFVHTYTPTSIDLPTQEHNFHTEELNNPNHIIPQNSNKPLVAKPIPQPIRIIQVSNPKHHLVHSNTHTKITPGYAPLVTVNSQNQYLVQEQKQYHNQNHKQYLQEVTPTSKPLVLYTQKDYPPLVAPNQIKPTSPYVIVQSPPIYSAETPKDHLPGLQFVNSAPDNPLQNHEDPNALSSILKRLQESNALPHTLTEDNIDNSIKTLINILRSFKKGQKFSGPIVVADVNEGHLPKTDSDSHNPLTQMFPANTPEGGTPGRPGIDYPALSSIPQTNFDCHTQRYKGFFADPDTNCQVWHYCDLNGGQASFLCPNGTIFSQVALTCDWWFNVKCSTTTQLYVLNERLYKYIIPLKPKFPEDYAGPLVDRYLAMKFQEMEEKLNKEKKEKEKDKSEEVDELQLLEDQNQDSTSHTPEPLRSHK